MMPDVIPDPLSPSLPAGELSAPLLPAAPNPEQTTPMIDVHAPHHTVHTWRDFFVHIATIVVGLRCDIRIVNSYDRRSMPPTAGGYLRVINHQCASPGCLREVRRPITAIFHAGNQRR